MNCASCGINNLEDAKFCCGCGSSLSTPTTSNVGSLQDGPIRYHGLDALRAIAMLLGIVLHAALPYIPNVEAFWPADKNSSHVIRVIFEFINVWRMPLFFILAGFFAHLVINRKSWKSWWGNRLLRIGLPLVVFTPVVALTIPWIFQYGRTGEFIFFYSNEGQPHHLWFLWHLMIFVILTAIFRLPYLLGKRFLNRISWFRYGRSRKIELNRNRLGFIDIISAKSRNVLSRVLFRSRFPIGFIILCSVIIAPSGGELIINPIASGLYFAMGYSLYRNTPLLTFLKAHWKYYFLSGLVGLTIYTVANYMYGYEEITSVSKEQLGMLILLTKTICAVLFSYAFIGVSENRFGSYNPKLRFMSDGAYWMYLIHLPIVTLITFLMFKLHIPIELKFLIAIVLTFLICLATYRIFVRSTFIGILLNGKRHPFRMTSL